MGQQITVWLVDAVLVAMLVGLFVTIAFYAKKARIASGIQIQCSSGDNEVMSFNYNFNEGESEDSKQSKIREAWARIEERRKENHEKWLKVKQEAIAENEAKVAGGEELKLHSVTQVPAPGAGA